MGAAESSNAAFHGVKSSPSSGVIAVPLLASQPLQRPDTSSKLSHAPLAPTDGTNQWQLRRAMAPWKAPGSAMAARRAASQAARVLNRFLCAGRGAIWVGGLSLASALDMPISCDLKRSQGL